ncbi:MAG: DUF4886 domain-containing protein [Clostridia bacterium]|nr:DUF4886 domain-containing protein [Clostridia bacterium]
MRKALKYLLLSAMLLVCGTGVNAETVTSGTCGAEGSEVGWSYADGTLTISGTGEMKAYSNSSLPPWTALASEVKNVVVGEGVTNVSQLAFKNMSAIENVSLPSTLEKIDAIAFYGTKSLEFIEIPEGVTELGYSLFIHGGLKRIVLPSTVTVFPGSGLSIYGEDVIGNVTAYCYENTTAYTNSYWCTGQSDTFRYEAICGKGTSGDINWLVTDEDTLIVSGKGSMSFTYTTAPWSQYNSSIKSIYIENGIENVPDQCFRGMLALESVTLAPSVTSIGFISFYGTQSLEFFEVPDSVTKIGVSAFIHGGLKRIVIPESVTSLADSKNTIFGEDVVGNVTVYCYENSYAHTNSKAKGVACELIIADGKENGVSWYVTETGTLLLCGNGEITTSPWSDYAESITKVYVETGVTGTADLASLTAAEEIILPETVTAIDWSNMPQGTYTLRLEDSVKSITGTAPSNVTVKAFENSYAISYAKENNMEYEEMKSLKVLAIGNSFSQDATYYMYEVAKECGAEQIMIGRLYQGGQPLKTHWNNAKNNTPAYVYSENMTGEWQHYSNMTMEYGIKAHDWDIIVLQGWYPDVCYGLDTEDNDNAFTNLTAYINENKTNPDAELAFYMIWSMNDSYSSNIVESQGKIENNGDTLSDYNRIVAITKAEVLTNSNYKYIIPVGTAIQNARTSYISGILDGTKTSAETLYNYGMQRDVYHLNNFGQYIASMTWIKALKGWSIDNTTAPDAVSAVFTDEIVEICKKAANDAISSPYAVTPSDKKYKMTYNAAENTVTVVTADHSVVGEGVSAILAAAEYKDGVLDKVTVSDKTIKCYQHTSCRAENEDNIFSVASPAEGNTLKIMLWDSVDGMTPLCDAAE